MSVERAREIYDLWADEWQWHTRLGCLRCDCGDACRLGGRIQRAIDAASLTYDLAVAESAARATVAW